MTTRSIELAQAGLADVGVEGAAEVLRRDDGRGVDRPEVGELDAALLEDGLAGLPVGLDDVAPLPGDLVVGVHAVGAEDPLDRQSPCWVAPFLAGPAHRLGHPFSLVPSMWSLLISLAGGTDTPQGRERRRVGRPVRRFPTTYRAVCGQPLGAEVRSSAVLSWVRGWQRAARRGACAATRSRSRSPRRSRTACRPPRSGGRRPRRARAAGRGSPSRSRGRRTPPDPSRAGCPRPTWPSRARSSSVSGRPLQALRTPAIALSRSKARSRRTA